MIFYFQLISNQRKLLIKLFESKPYRKHYIEITLNDFKINLLLINLWPGRSDKHPGRHDFLLTITRFLDHWVQITGQQLSHNRSHSQQYEWQTHDLSFDSTIGSNKCKYGYNCCKSVDHGKTVANGAKNPHQSQSTNNDILGKKVNIQLHKLYFYAKIYPGHIIDYIIVGKRSGFDNFDPKIEGWKQSTCATEEH